MNKPNPLVPQGTFADTGKSHIRITVFAILAVHVVLLGVLLIAGCNKKDTGTQAGDPGLPPAVAPLTTDPTNLWLGHPAANVTTTPPPGFVALPSNSPPFAVEPPFPAASAFTEHTVVQGDSFYTLGKRYKVGYTAIADVNPGVDSTKLKIGQKIKIPPPKPATSSAAPAPGAAAPAPMSASSEKVYSVKSGDTLIKIARNHGVTPKELQAANNLRTTQIRVGQKLKIPGKAPILPPEGAAPPPGIPGLTPDGTAPIR